MSGIALCTMVFAILCFLMLVLVLVVVCAVSAHVTKIMKTPEYITKFIVSLLGKGGRHGGGARSA